MAPPVDGGSLFRWTKVDARDQRVVEPDPTLSKTLLVYEMLSHRFLSLNSLMWQVPVLALTAQAFLLTISLSPGVTVLARCLSSGLGMLISALCLQLMMRHRYLAHSDRLKLETLENCVLNVPTEARVNGKPADADRFLDRQPSHVWWQIGMLLFLLVSAAVFVIALASPQLLSG